MVENNQEEEYKSRKEDHQDDNIDTFENIEEDISEKQEENEIPEVVIETLEERIQQLEDEIKKSEEEKDSIYRRAQRLKTDFNNFRNRTRQEKEKLNREVKAELIKEILPVIDNFERALTAHENQSEFRTGVEMIYKQLKTVLEQEGLKVINAEGESFDHEYHEAVLQEEDSGVEPGTVIEVLEKGYILDDRVIRPARVKVAQ